MRGEEPTTWELDQYEEDLRREACVYEVEKVVAESPGFPVLQTIVEIIRHRLGTSGACIVRQKRELCPGVKSIVEFHYGCLSSDSMRKLSLREEEVTCKVGPLGCAWYAYRPLRWGAAEAQRDTQECRLFKPIARRVKNMLVAPIYRERPPQIASALGPYEVLGYLCLFNKHILTHGRKPRKEYRLFDHDDEVMATRLCRSISVPLTYECMMESTTLAIVEALDRRDPKNAEHSRRVADHMADIGKAIYQDKQRGKNEGWDEFDLRDVGDSWYVGLLHDVGKLGMPDHVLKGESQPSRDAENFRHIHPHTSAAIVEQIRGLRLEIVQAITEHHEYFKGPDGYLTKAQGTRVGWLARILAVADTYDSMRRSHGEWRGFSKMAAYAQLQRLRGTKLDSYVVDTFLKTKEFKEVRNLLHAREKAKKGRTVLVGQGAEMNFVCQSYCCAILYHEIDRGILGMEGGTIGKKTPADRLWCPYEGAFSQRKIVERIHKTIGQTHQHLDLPERARAAELAFLHIRWNVDAKSDQTTFEKILRKIEDKALRRKVLPIAMPPGIGILVPHCNCGQAFGLAQEFHSAIAEGYAGSPRDPVEPAIGIAYVPNKDTVGCACLVGRAVIASAYALRRADSRGAIVFFERHQLDAME